MKIIQALLGEHGAIYPLFGLIEDTAVEADLQQIKTQTTLLRAALMSHADIEDSLLRPAIGRFLPNPAPSAPTDHELIAAGLSRVLESSETAEARRLLLGTVAAARRHFLKEETIVFDLARRCLSTQVQEELGTEWARIRGIAGCALPCPVK